MGPQAEVLCGLTFRRWHPGDIRNTVLALFIHPEQSSGKPGIIAKFPAAGNALLPAGCTGDRAEPDSPRVWINS
jgi:hypothetical protein